MNDNFFYPHFAQNTTWSHKIPLGLTRSKTAIGIQYDITEPKLLSEQNRLARNNDYSCKGDADE